MSGFNNRESILARPCMGVYQLSLSGGLADSSVAIQRVDAECSQRVSMAIVIGTPISAPGIPQGASPCGAWFPSWTCTDHLRGRVPWGYPEVEGPMSSPSAANLKVVIFRPYAGPSLKCEDEVFSA